MYSFLTKITFMSQSAFSSIYIKSSRDLNTILRGGTHSSTGKSVMFFSLSLSLLSVSVLFVAKLSVWDEDYVIDFFMDLTLYYWPFSSVVLSNGIGTFVPFLDRQRKFFKPFGLKCTC